jgi:hypothetical protein
VTTPARQASSHLGPQPLVNSFIVYKGLISVNLIKGLNSKTPILKTPHD